MRDLLVATSAGATGPLSMEIVSAGAAGAMVRITPPKEARPGLKEGLPVDVICVIDVSGSMGSSATVQDENGNTESHGLSVLDVVKHATATVGAMLQPRDRLAVITFSSRASVNMSLTSMDAAGKAQLKTTLDALYPSGSTNLWDGLQHAMDLVSSTAAARSTAILLLTDGQPTEEPPRGHIPTLERYLTKFGSGSLPFVVNTVGFGYSLNSKLLRGIADKTGGTYVFIPDSGLVGTVFLNLVANVQSTVAVGLQLTINSSTPLNPQSFNPVLQCAPAATSASGLLGSVQFGQPRDIFFTTPKDAPGGDVTATLIYRYEGAEFTITAASYRAAQSEDEANAVIDARAAALFCQHADSLNPNAVKTLDDGLAAMQPATPFIEALRKDVAGQVSMALEPRFVDKWGKHFLPSIVRANMLQQCNNFKDFSVQHFGSALFHFFRDVGEEAFLKLPPPTPSNAHELQRGGGGGRPASPANMAAYYNYQGGCVTADSLVMLADGTTSVRACDVRRGMVLAPSCAVVKCVVKIKTPATGVSIVRFPWTKLAITEYHPIVNPSTGEWAFPIHCPGAVSSLETGHHFVYTYVLEGGPSASINGVEVVALGHGLTTNDVVQHEYLGSDKILQDLTALPGFQEDGAVVVDAFQRDAKSRRVNGIVAAQRATAAFP